LSKHQLAWQREAFEHGLGRDGIGRRHNSAEREADCPRQAGDNQMGDHADRKCGERYCTDSEKQDGAEIALELFPDSEVGTVHEERRQKYDNHQVRIQVNGRKAWHECHGDAANQQRGSGWQLKTLG
jgi:hypothetical protein